VWCCTKKECAGDGAKASERVDGKWEKCHVVVKEVANDIIATNQSAGYGIVFVATT
jgi:hypothetical protein